MDYEGRKHTAPHTFTAEAAYAVHFLQRGYSANRQILNYKGRKHTAPHTFTAEAAYAVHFLQRGYSAHPQIVDFEGRKHTAPPHIYCRQQPTLYISSSEATYIVAKAGNTQPPTHLLLKQPSCTFLARWITKAGNTQPPTHLLQTAAYAVHLLPARLSTDCGFRRQETHSPPHIYS